jgi:hypothetical protein
VIHLTYFLVTDATVQRWVGITNFMWLPFGRNFDNRSAVNVSTPRQFTFGNFKGVRQYPLTVGGA